MKKVFCVVLAMFITAYFVPWSSAAEHGGKEHGGTAQTAEHSDAEHAKEHGGAEHGGMEHAGAGAPGEEMAQEPTAQDIRSTMENYVKDKSAVSGTFDVEDPVTGKTRKLTLVRVHERVGKTGDYYYSCADFNDTESGELLDLDLDVEDKAGVLGVVDVRIHKVDGKERYTYDANDNRISVES